MNRNGDAVAVAPQVGLPAPEDEAAAEPTAALPAPRGPVVQGLDLMLDNPTDRAPFIWAQRVDQQCVGKPEERRSEDQIT